MSSNRLFDHSFENSIFNPTHGDGFHPFSRNFLQSFSQLDKEFEGNSFEIHDPIMISSARHVSPPILLEVSNGKIKNRRSILASMKYDDNELVYAVPMKKEKGVHTIPDGIYSFGNVLIIGLELGMEYSIDFMEMMKKALLLTDIKVIDTEEWYDDSGYDTKDLSLTICDKNGNYWKILFG